MNMNIYKQLKIFGSINQNLECNNEWYFASECFMHSLYVYTISSVYQWCSRGGTRGNGVTSLVEETNERYPTG